MKNHSVQVAVLLAPLPGPAGILYRLFYCQKTALSADSAVFHVAILISC